MDKIEKKYRIHQRLAVVEFLYLQEKTNNEYFNMIYNGWERKIKVNRKVLICLIFFGFFTVFIQNSMMHAVNVISSSKSGVVPDPAIMVFVFASFDVFILVMYVVTILGIIAAIYKLLTTRYKIWKNGESAVARNYCKKSDIENVSKALFESNLRLSKYMNEISELKENLEDLENSSDDFM